MTTPATATQVHVRREALDNASLVEIDLPPLADGAVRLEIESFSVTSNNITYAVVGEQIATGSSSPRPRVSASCRCGVTPR